MLQSIQGTPLADYLYYLFHILGFLAVFLFNIWHGKKREICAKHSILTTLFVYSLTYLWIYIQYWVESGFSNFGGMNIVRGFVYIPIIALPIVKFFKIEWKRLCDFIAPCVCLTQSISHIGCIFVCCCAGYPSDWGIYNIYYQGLAFPSQLLEAFTAFCIFLFLVYRGKRSQFRTTGIEYPIMLILFGSTRFLWEFARNNEKILWDCSSLALHALFMAIVGVIILILQKRQKPNKKSSTRRKKRK